MNLLLRLRLLLVRVLVANEVAFTPGRKLNRIKSRLAESRIWLFCYYTVPYSSRRLLSGKDL